MCDIYINKGEILMNKRLLISVITGSILGVVCIIGASVRALDGLTTIYLFSFWFNRLVMGFFIGFLPVNITLNKRLLRGLIAGLFISFAFYSATEFFDLMGFLAGGLYGIIIEYVTYRFEDKL